MSDLSFQPDEADVQAICDFRAMLELHGATLSRGANREATLAALATKARLQRKATKIRLFKNMDSPCITSRAFSEQDFGLMAIRRNHAFLAASGIDPVT